MPIATIHSFKTVGTQAVPVTVECEISSGIGIHLVGLADAAVKETLLRTITAMETLGYIIPGKKIIINLAPADLRKDGTGYDLPIALAILAASGKADLPDADKYIVAGELALDGSVRHVHGYIQAAELARREGKALLLPRAAADLAAEVMKESVDIFEIDSIPTAVQTLEGKRPACTAWEHVCKMQEDKPAEGRNLWDSIKGNYGAKRALEIAAAGGHGVLLVGGPKSPKAMLAKAMLDILPPLSAEENLEVQRIHAVNSNFIENGRRPFEQVSASVSLQALLGGGLGARPGRVSLAHLGVLLIDNAAILPKSALEALRAPLEDKAVTISRLKEKVTYPADFIPVLATLPCPCGHYGEGETCTCTPGQREAYLARLSGPVFDRLAVQAWTQNAKNPEALPDGESAQAVAKRVAKARQVQIERQGKLNEELSMHDLDINFCSDAVKDFLGDIMCKLGLSVKAYYRILRLARTIADLEGAEDITTVHITEAASYRFLDRRMEYENENQEKTCHDHSPRSSTPAAAAA